MTVDPNLLILELQTFDIQNTGLHDMLLCITLPDYNVEYCQAFAALVSDCEVTEL